MDKFFKKIIANKKFLSLVLLMYTGLILYLMLFAFNRLERSAYTGSYRYSLEISRIPLWFPSELSSRWIFSMGNLFAFIPFGILIPLRFKTNYLKFIIGFLLAIFLMEIIQMISYLGSFDVEDILVNALGGTIGYISCKLGLKFKRRRFITTILIACLLALLMIFLADYINNNLIYHLKS